MILWDSICASLMQQGLPEVLIRSDCVTEEDSLHLIELISSMKPSSILEVGTFVGMSTGIIALSMPMGSSLTCVDPNLPVNVQSSDFGYFEERGSLEFTRKMLKGFGKLQSVTLIEAFFSCYPTCGFKEQLDSLGINYQQIALAQEQIEAYAPYQLVLIDGDHYSEAVLSDLLLAHQFISENGVIMLHDVTGSWKEQVVSGIHKFIEKKPTFSISTSGNWGFLKKNNTNRFIK